MTMIMVTHDVDEAVYLSNRIVVMSPRPSKIEKIIDIRLPYPRDRNNADFVYFRNEILKILDFAGKEQDLDYVI